MKRRIFAMMMALALLAGMMTLSVSAFARSSNLALTPTLTLTSTPDVPIARIGAVVVPIRSGPGENFAQIGELFNAITQILGYSEDGNWLLVRYGVGQGWLQASQVTITTNITIPVVTYTSPTPFTVISASPTWTPTPLRPTYDSADLSPTAPVVITRTPLPPPLDLSPTIPSSFPTLTLPASDPTATRVGRVTIALQASPGYARLITEEDMRIASDIIRLRLQDYFVRDLNIVTIDDIIYLEFSDNGNINNLLEAIQQQGTLEIVDLSDFTLEFRRNLLGSTVYTTGYQRAYPLDDGLVNPYTNDAFETVVTIENVNRASAFGSDGVWYVDLTMRYADSADLLSYTQQNIGTLMGVVLDGQLIAMPLIERPIININVINDFEPFTVDQAVRLASIFRHGTLPFPMAIIEYNIVE